MDYLLDTNIIVIYSRESEIADRIEEKFQLFDKKNSLAISIVTLGELDALIRKLKLGEKRKRKINRILNSVAKIGLNHKEIISRYRDIDAFSQEWAQTFLWVLSNQMTENLETTSGTKESLLVLK